MRFTVQAWTPGTYVIGPEGSEPLPATLDSREAAQRIADTLGQRYRAAHEKVPTGDPEHIRRWR